MTRRYALTFVVVALVCMNLAACVSQINSKTIRQYKEWEVSRVPTTRMIVHTRVRGWQMPEGKSFYNVLGFDDNGLAVAAESKDHWGIIDQKGHWVIQPVYEAVHPFYEGLAAVEKNNKWGFVDKSGKLVIEPIFAAAGDFRCDFSEGLCAVQLPDLGYGYIDKTGNVVIKLDRQYYGAHQFKFGVARVNYLDWFTTSDKLIDAQGRVLRNVLRLPMAYQ